MGKRLGLIDIHLLASAILSEAVLWTLDIKLKHKLINQAWVTNINIFPFETAADNP